MEDEDRQQEEDDGLQAGEALVGTWEKAFTEIDDGQTTQGPRGRKERAAAGPSPLEWRKAMPLAARQPIYAGEPEEYRLKRDKAFTRTWTAMESDIKVGAAPLRPACLPAAAAAARAPCLPACCPS